MKKRGQGKRQQGRLPRAPHSWAESAFPLWQQDGDWDGVCCCQGKKVNVNLSHVKEIWPRRVALQAPSDGCGAFVAGELSR
jgi:hypothetical protein